MREKEDMIAYYCGRLHSSWARKKAEAYLRILAEEEEKRYGAAPDQDKKKAAALNAGRRSSAIRSEKNEGIV